jgi:hypothetical protein
MRRRAITVVTKLAGFGRMIIKFVCSFCQEVWFFARKAAEGTARKIASRS